MAIDRVAIRVSEVGHNIPSIIVANRYNRGMQNFFKIYVFSCNEGAVFDNSDGKPLLLFQGIKEKVIILNENVWNIFKSEIL